MRLIRLTERRDFLAAADLGRRFHVPALTVQVRDRGRDDPVQGLRVGFTASRKAGGSVERSRIKRRLRAAAEIALGLHAERCLDVVIVARAEAISADFAALCAGIAAAPERASKPRPRSAKPNSKPAPTRSRAR